MLGVKRIIALVLVGAFVIFIAYGMMSDKIVPEGFSTLVGTVIGYYFGRGALNAGESDQPKI